MEFIPEAGGIDSAFEENGFTPFAPPSAHWLATAFVDVQLLPLWSNDEENAEHAASILAFHVEPCEDFRSGVCRKKAESCFGYHYESQVRRCPVDVNSGQLMYWDAPCQAWSGDASFCPNGDACLFAHGFEEVSFHPAKYKTKLCNGRDCRGEGICCFAHGESELRHWASECYGYFSIVGPVLGFSAPQTSKLAAATSATAWDTSRRIAGQQAGAIQGKFRFCSAYPNVSQCRRGTACAFAHSRDEVKTPLLRVEEEEHQAEFMTEPFFTQSFKTLWCPIGAQHDWQSCVYAHTYQDARRRPDIGYGPQPCPYWSKKDTRAAYSQRCPLGLRCPYSHGAKEQLYHPMYFRTTICRDMQQRCPRQNLCAFYHKRAERRAVGPDTMDYTQPLKKKSLPPDWAASFLTPPFFQEGEAEQMSASQASGAAPGAWGPMPGSTSGASGSGAKASSSTAKACGSGGGGGCGGGGGGGGGGSGKASKSSASAVASSSAAAAASSSSSSRGPAHQGQSHNGASSSSSAVAAPAGGASGDYNEVWGGCFQTDEGTFFAPVFADGGFGMPMFGPTTMMQMQPCYFGGVPEEAAVGGQQGGQQGGGGGGGGVGAGTGTGTGGPAEANAGSEEAAETTEENNAPEVLVTDSD